MIIAIDGPAGSGKSTVSKLIARRLGFFYLDTGAMYRALTYQAIKKAVDWHNIQALIELAKRTKIDLYYRRVRTLQVFVDGEEISEAIRRPEITNQVHYLAKIPEVRQVMVTRQREMAKDRDVILEGRDTTSVVFPDADYKIYLDALPQERAKRRWVDLKKKNIEMTMEEILADQEKRDQSDFSRKVGPLKIVPRAMVVDTTNLDINEVIFKIIRIISSKKSKYNFFYGFLWIISIFLARIFFRLKVYGQKNIPQEGGFILASNHLSYLDPYFLGCASTRQLSFLARDNLFRNRLFAWLIRNLNAYPIKRTSADRGALINGIKLITRGKALVLFPEGTRSTTGELGPGKGGIGFIALQSGCPVIPAYIQGSNKALPKSAKLIRFCPVTVKFGPPVDLNDLLRKPERKEAYLEATERIMQAIKDLKSDLSKVTI